MRRCGGGSGRESSHSSVMGYTALALFRRWICVEIRRLGSAGDGGGWGEVGFLVIDMTSRCGEEGYLGVHLSPGMSFLKSGGDHRGIFPDGVWSSLLS